MTERRPSTTFLIATPRRAPLVIGAKPDASAGGKSSSIVFFSKQLTQTHYNSGGKPDSRLAETVCEASTDQAPTDPVGQRREAVFTRSHATASHRLGRFTRTAHCNVAGAMPAVATF
jgi:hypothetical protein